MSSGRPDPAAVRQLMKLAGVSPGGQVSDRELVERFVQDRSEAAFADLMARHGPMVLAVCRRHLRDPHAAEDAFQATFIVLARKAGSVKWKESIGGWLFEVASRVSRKAAGQVAKRAAREGGNPDHAPEPATQATPAHTDLTSLQTALDDELRNLPEKLRAPVVLCHLEGLSQDEVARHLGITDGQLRGRLYRAKERLRERLLRRGFTLSAVLLALTIGPAAQAVPAMLASGTLRLASSAPNLVPDPISQLAIGAMNEMGTSFKTIATLTFLGVLGLAAAGYAVRSATADAPGLDAPAPQAPLRAERPPVPFARAQLPKPKPVTVRKADDDKKPEDKRERVGAWIKGVETAKNALRVKLDEGDQETTIELDAKAVLLFANKPVKLSDLQPGMRADLFFPADQSATRPVEVQAGWPRQGAELSAVDAIKGTLTFQIKGDGGVGFPVTLELAKDAAVNVDGLGAGLADVPTGRKIELELSLDKKSVVGVEADGDKGDIPALVVSCDPVALTILVEFEAEAADRGRRVTLCLPVNADAKVRLAGSDAKLSDLKERMPVRLKMTADRKGVAAVLAGHPLPKEKDDDSGTK